MFDPDHPEKNFILKNGEVEEVIEVKADANDEENIPTVENVEIISLKTIDDIADIETTVNDKIDDIVAKVVDDKTEGRDTDTTSIVIEIPDYKQ